MDDVTDTVFRQVMNDCGAPDLAMTEFVNVDGLMSVGRPKLLKKLRFAKTEQGLIAQLWGLKPENFTAVAEQIADGTMARELGLRGGCNFVGVDLNMGCPAKSEVTNGTCAALIRRESWPLAEQIITATQQGLAGRLPLSVKTRVGFGEVDMEWFDFLLGFDLDMLTVHGRTKRQMSKVPADWDLIGEVVKKRDAVGTATKIVGNGDVRDRAHGLELAKQYNLDGIMIGRGVFANPFCFLEKGSDTWQSIGRKERIDLYEKHVRLFADTWQQGERPIQTLNKFCKVYIQSFDGAKELREHLMNAHSVGELLEILEAAKQ